MCQKSRLEPRFPPRAAAIGERQTCCAAVDLSRTKKMVLGCRVGDAIGSGCRSAGKDDIYGRSGMTGSLSVDKRRLAIGLACTVIRFLPRGGWVEGGGQAGGPGLPGLRGLPQKGAGTQAGPSNGIQQPAACWQRVWAVGAADEDPFPTSCHLRGLTSDGPGPTRLGTPARRFARPPACQPAMVSS